MTNPFVIAKTAGGKELAFLPGLANRHGLITGATGTGKTVTLQVLADNFSRLRAGVPRRRQGRPLRYGEPRCAR